MENISPKTTTRTDASASSMEMVHRIVAWGFGFLAIYAAGCGIGLILDILFWNISFDYVYSPHERLRWFVRWSLAPATIFAAAGSTWKRTPASLGVLVTYSASCVVVTVLLSISCGFAGVLYGEIFPTSTADLQLAPMRRVQFCAGMWHGTGWAFLISALLSGFRLYRGRKSDSPVGDRAVSKT